jgi:hypothetical protein
MTSEERAKRLYQLNGKLHQALKELGACYGIASSLLGRENLQVRNLDRIYSNLKETQDAIREEV